MRTHGLKAEQCLLGIEEGQQVEARGGNYKGAHTKTLGAGFYHPD